MSNDLIARLRDWSDGPDTDDLCRDAAHALEAQAREIEALRAFAQGLVDDYQSEDGMAGAKYIVRDAVAALASRKAVTP
jgi:hypothetical protein